jgi:hypothetical protein
VRSAGEEESDGASTTKSAAVWPSARVVTKTVDTLSVGEESAGIGVVEEMEASVMVMKSVSVSVVVSRFAEASAKAECMASASEVQRNRLMDPPFFDENEMGVASAKGR